MSALSPAASLPARAAAASPACDPESVITLINTTHLYGISGDNGRLSKGEALQLMSAAQYTHKQVADYVH